MPADSIVFDRASEYYDQTRGYPAGVPERVAAALCAAGGLGAESRVLEIGVGTGRIALPLAARVQSVVGIDLSRPMLARLRAKRVDEAVQPLLADATALPLRTASCEAVVAVHVFHLVPRWRDVLDEVRRVLVPGGRLLSASDDQLFRELWEAVYAVVPKRANVGVSGGEFDFPLQAGFVRAGDLAEVRYRERVELATVLQRLEDRVWSVTWRMSPAEHADVVARMRQAMIDRYGSTNAVLDVDRVFSVRAFVPA